MNQSRNVFSYLVWIALAGCAADVASDPNTPAAAAEASDDVSGITRTLRVGMQGEDIARLHARLTKYGYFPNDELRRQYPAFQPIVAAAPHDPYVFDERSQAAVERYQYNSGLPVTGEADAETIAALAARRCGVPDGLAPADPDEKFSDWFPDVTENRRAFTYLVWNNDPVDLTVAQTEAAIANAFSQWSAVSNLSFTPWNGSGGIDFLLYWDNFAPEADGFIALTRPDRTGVAFNELYRWVLAWPPNAGDWNLEQVAAHEIGHLLNLNHSSFPALMRNDGGGQRVLTADDRVSVSVKYDTWWSRQSPTALDVAVGPSTDDPIWIAGSDGRLYSGNNANLWLIKPAMPNSGQARRVAVDATGNVWAVDHSNRLACYQVSSNTWRTQPGCIKDIAFGANNMFWALDCNGRAMRWTASGRCSNSWPFPWTSANTSTEPGNHIAVRSGGQPTIVTNTNKVLLRDSSTVPGSTAWVELVGGGLALDIAIDNNNYTWVIGLDNGIWVHNEQPCRKANGSACTVLPAGDNGAPPRAQWVKMTEGTAKRITASPTGPIVVGSDDGIYETTK